MKIRGGVVLALLALWPLAAQAADPIKLGMVVPLTGPIADAGRYGVQGAKLAVEEINAAGGVLGRPIELIIEDDQTQNPTTVLAFTKLADNKDIVAFLGPTRSTQIQAIAPSVLQAGRPVMIGGTDPTLTKSGNPWFFRFRPNDTYTARAMTAFGIGKLGKKSWAIVHATDAFGSNAKSLFAEALKANGITPVLIEGQPNNAPDYTAVVLAVKQSGADVLATFITFEPDVAIFARQLKQLGVNPVWLGSPSITTTTARKLAGPSLHGTYAVADFHPDANPEAKAFAARYTAAYKTTPDFFASWPYDAVHVLAKAIAAAGDTSPEKIRQALLAVKDYHGVEGTYNFDANGDGLHGYNIVKNSNGEIVVEQRIDFND
ncbi:ethanolamine utilization protein EutJ [Bradyrhizobium sp. SSBR45G]|uniref:ABC transporter substrate-binding protein n=1 Tax=unclassified Bradyrhizobium TaxID=2631580 RepID=UPI002342A47D|nr:MULTISPECIES: ABC transporter substrate-binding protein [unclassified Bradyrhizobium]GLH81849.1 ethanolamine utilization protein EutJ [Bradyrhizobium sp. SSBR45G]GLH89328.1 ethanolamine utilization protein EutJ [Bradyrhizobium sp. SSBR45R]